MKIHLIKQRAKEQKISLEEVAERAGIKRATFFNYLGGRTPFTVDALERVANILDISMKAFFEEEEEKLTTINDENLPASFLTPSGMIGFLEEKIESGDLSEETGTQLIQGITALFKELKTERRKLTMLLKAIEDL